MMFRAPHVSRNDTDTLAVRLCQFANGPEGCLCSNTGKEKVCATSEKMALHVREYCRNHPLPADQ